MDMEESCSVSINNSGAFYSTCVELEIAALAVNTIIEVRGHMLITLIFALCNLQYISLCVFDICGYVRKFSALFLVIYTATDGSWILLNIVAILIVIREVLWIKSFTGACLCLPPTIDLGHV